MKPAAVDGAAGGVEPQHVGAADQLVQLAVLDQRAWVEVGHFRGHRHRPSADVPLPDRRDRRAPFAQRGKDVRRAHSRRADGAGTGDAHRHGIPLPLGERAGRRVADAAGAREGPRVLRSTMARGAGAATSSTSAPTGRPPQLPPRDRAGRRPAPERWHELLAAPRRRDAGGRRRLRRPLRRPRAGGRPDPRCASPTLPTGAHAPRRVPRADLRRRPRTPTPSSTPPAYRFRYQSLITPRLGVRLRHGAAARLRPAQAAAEVLGGYDPRALRLRAHARDGRRRRAGPDLARLPRGRAARRHAPDAARRATAPTASRTRPTSRPTG